MEAEPRGTGEGTAKLIEAGDAHRAEVGYDYWDESYVAGAFEAPGERGDWTVVLGFDGGLGMPCAETLSERHPPALAAGAELRRRDYRRRVAHSFRPLRHRRGSRRLGLYNGASVCWRAGVEKAANAASSSLPRSSWPSLALHCPRTIHKTASAAATRTLAMTDDPSVEEAVFCSRATISGRHAACEGCGRRGRAADSACGTPPFLHRSRAPLVQRGAATSVSVRPALASGAQADPVAGADQRGVRLRDRGRGSGHGGVPVLGDAFRPPKPQDIGHYDTDVRSVPERLCLALRDVRAEFRQGHRGADEMRHSK
ncbi:DUF6461 domain-containing protein [Streptomyces sp. Ag109_O5-10]|uniref:DUF6461 domain-containing protein n=1 Tax=Streptomyces sp. Ag109_O5-10 TaxID=1855349 RepID=UPI00210A017D|nr:DUF6461 domain-containing protein [Streptomyces sp. Ag109_O5-10]